MKTDILQYIVQHSVEILGTILCLVYLYLSIKERIGLWIFGFLSSALYIIVFFESKFYADMSLQVYYLAVSVYGWLMWKRKTGNSDSSDKLQVSFLSTRQMIQYLASVIAVYFIYYLILKYATDSTIPIMDSLVGALSVVATWMLTRKKIENWLLWILADAVATGLFAYKQLYPTAILYLIYTVMAFVGYYEWKKNYNLQLSEDNSNPNNL